MKRLVAFAAVTALFAVGVVVGVLGTHLYYAHRLGQPGGPPAMIARGFEDRLQRELGLDAEQMQRIHEILREGHEQTEQIRAEMAPRLHEQLEAMHRRIVEEVLTPEQRVRFEELQAQHRRRADTFFLHPEPGPGAFPRHPH